MLQKIQGKRNVLLKKCVYLIKKELFLNRMFFKL